MAITEPDLLREWLGEVEIHPVEGGAMTINWLNTDERGNAPMMAWPAGTST